jgi:hypothetical protein
MHTDFEVRACVNKDGVSTRLVKPSKLEAAAELEAAVQEIHQEMMNNQPALWHRGLIIESGSVEQIMTRARSVLFETRQSYLLVASRGAVFLLPQLADGGNGLSRLYQTSAEAAEVQPDMQVVIGASAVLALVEHYLEMTAGEGAAAHTTFNPLLSVTETAQSPYPPHSLPSLLWKGAISEENGDEAEGHKVISRGRLIRESKGSLGNFLLLRSQCWSRPLAALANDQMGSLVVEFENESEPPDEALLIESLVPLATGAGRIEWQAEFSLTRKGETVAVGVSPLLLRFDSVAALARADGALGGCLMAFVRDPIVGEHYGLAPALVTDMRAEELGLSFA